VTDHPRFRARKGDFETAYRDHHGGRLVHLMLRLVERREPADGTDRNPMLALDRALLEGEQGPTPPPGKSPSAVRAAVVGIFALLALSAIVHVLGAFNGTGWRADSRVAVSIRPGAHD
jgi:hypothetical protein